MFEGTGFCEAWRHTQKWLAFTGLVCGVEEEWQEMRIGRGKESVVLIPSPSLQVSHWMRRGMNKATGTSVLITD